MDTRRVLGLTNLIEPQILVVEADYQMQFFDQRLDINAPGVLVTLPQNPTVGLNHILFGSGVSWRLSGGPAHPLPVDPLVIAAGENVQPVFSTSGWQLGQSSGGSSTLMSYTVFVAKNGNDATADGSVGKPFLTVQAAMQHAWTAYVEPVGPQPPFVRPCVFVNAGTYDDGPLILPPNITVMGEGLRSTRIIGTWGIDARWTNVPGDNNDCRSAWIGCALYGSEDATAPAVAIDFNAFNAGQGQVWGVSTEFVGDVSISEKLANPVSNDANFQGCLFTGNVTIGGCPCLFSACDGLGSLTFNQLSGSGVDNVGTLSGGSWGNITVNAATEAAPAYNLIFGHSVRPGATLTLNGNFSTINAVESAVPLQSLITLAGGAMLNNIRRLNQPYFSGSTAARPAAPYVGQQFFDTTLSLAETPGQRHGPLPQAWEQPPSASSSSSIVIALTPMRSRSSATSPWWVRVRSEVEALPQRSAPPEALTRKPLFPKRRTLV